MHRHVECGAGRRGVRRGVLKVLPNFHIAQSIQEPRLRLLCVRGIEISHKQKYTRIISHKGNMNETAGQINHARSISPLSVYVWVSFSFSSTPYHHIWDYCSPCADKEGRERPHPAESDTLPAPASCTDWWRALQSRQYWRDWWLKIEIRDQSNKQNMSIQPPYL